MDNLEEEDIVEALRKARGLAEKTRELAQDMPPLHRHRLIQSTSSLVANLAMALDAVRKRSPDAPS